MKVAFTSCFRARRGTRQPVWAAIKQHEPDVLLLLGDCIYMDYAATLRHPKFWTKKRFAKKMYKKYKLQASVDSFRELVASVDKVGIIWDDHDFAWNNCNGAGPGKNHVPLNKRLISRGLHLQFSDWLSDDPLNREYPESPILNDLLAGDDRGVESHFNHDGVTFILSDGRYYREKQNLNHSTTLLGNDQHSWIENIAEHTADPIVLCSGSVLTNGSESWDKYRDIEWLKRNHFARMLVLSGDIHKNVFTEHEALGGLIEVTSSGAHRPGIGGDKGNFGLLNIDANDVKISLFGKKGIEKTMEIEL